MKILFLVLAIFLSINNSSYVYARPNLINDSKVTELEQVILEKETELESIKSELKDYLDVTSPENSLIGKIFEHEGIEILINNIYFTDERNNSEEDFENVLVVEYTVTNFTDTEYYSGKELELYINNSKADDYYLRNNKSDSISKNRSVETKVSFAFNGNQNYMELEFSNSKAWNDDEPIIIILEEVKELNLRK